MSGFVRTVRFVEFPSDLDCYGLLGVKRSASAKEIRSAYLSLLKSWHPDVATIPYAQALEKTQLLNLAYEILGNPSLRLSYDRAVSDRPPRPSAPRAPESPFSNRSRPKPKPQDYRSSARWKNAPPPSKLPPYWLSHEAFLTRLIEHFHFEGLEEFEVFLAWALAKSKLWSPPAGLPTPLLKPLAVHEGLCGAAEEALALPVQRALKMIPALLEPVSLIRQEVPQEALHLVSSPRLVKLALAEKALSDKRNFQDDILAREKPLTPEEPLTRNASFSPSTKSPYLRFMSPGRSSSFETTL